MMARKTIVCRRCERTQRHNCRGLCRACVKRCEHDGTLADYPRSVVTVRDIIEEMESWPGARRSFVDTAKALGLSQQSAATAYWRARKAGLVPQAKWDSWTRQWIEVA